VFVEIAAGFSVRRSVPLPANCRWLVARRGLAEALARAHIAVLAGGTTLYEACALGTPVVALPVVGAQRRTVRAFAATGAIVAVDAARPERALARAAREAAALLADPAGATRLARRAARLVDGRGAERVAQRLRALAASRRELHHAA
jgi:spore coat polysaccharide biosynthesis predicted glycosyltransferase SpsG